MLTLKKTFLKAYMGQQLCNSCIHRLHHYNPRTLGFVLIYTYIPGKREEHHKSTTFTTPSCKNPDIENLFQKDLLWSYLPRIEYGSRFPLKAGTSISAWINGDRRSEWRHINLSLWNNIKNTKEFIFVQDQVGTSTWWT